MNGDRELRAKLAKLEALFRRAGSLGEKSAAGAAIERLQGRLAGAGMKREPEVELKYSFPDLWRVDLFCAVCRKLCCPSHESPIGTNKVSYPQVARFQPVHNPIDMGAMGGFMRGWLFVIVADSIRCPADRETTSGYNRDTIVSMLSGCWRHERNEDHDDTDQT